MLTQSLSFLSTIWDGNFPIRIFPISLRNLDLSPSHRPGAPAPPPPRLFQLLDKQVAFELLIWMPWSRHWHMLKRQNTPSSFGLDFEKISLLTIFSCAYKSSCLSLCLPESLLMDLQATQAGLCGVPHHLSHSCFPVPLSHFPRTYVTCLQPTFSNDISPELFEWLNHNNSLRCIALSAFHKWENWGPSPDSLSGRGRPEFCLPNWKEILRTQLSHLYSFSLCYRGQCNAWCTCV